MTESLVEMARRHVREGEERIARHERLMDELIRDGHQRAWLEAQQLLVKLEAIQREFEDHLATAIRILEMRGK